jgi:hypothetical protein
MGIGSSYNKPLKLNESIHGNLDIGICGYDKLKNNELKPTTCSSNLPYNNANNISSSISKLDMPNLPINACIPIEKNIGVELKKDLNSISNNNVSKYNLSLCSHNYSTPADIPTNLKINEIVRSFVKMNESKLNAIPGIINSPGVINSPAVMELFRNQPRPIFNNSNINSPALMESFRNQPRPIFNNK